MIGQKLADRYEIQSELGRGGTEGDIGRTCGLDELDGLIEKGRTEVNPAARHDIYRQFEDVLMREAVMLPLFHEQVYRIARPDVEGLTVTYHGNPTVLYETLRAKQ